jgi:hypothetical protein
VKENPQEAAQEMSGVQETTAEASTDEEVKSQQHAKDA